MRKIYLFLLLISLMAMSSNSHARNWTCHATIHLGSSNYSYTIPGFGMTGNALTDREKRCKTDIQRRWLNNGKIWKHLGMSAADQNRFCKSRGTFRIDYGFDQRPKSWDFRKTLPSPPCKCPSTSCPAGMTRDSGGGCIKRLCKTSRPNNNGGLSGNPRTGIFAWNGYVYEIIPPIPGRGNCVFK